MKETVYGVFAVVKNGKKPSIVNIMNDAIFHSLANANLSAGDFKIKYGCDFEVHEIECEVK
jgi:hypothetical protein